MTTGIGTARTSTPPPPLLDRLRDSWRSWSAPVAITVLAALLRLVNLGHPGTLVFDETYYVKDSWTLLHLGYEAAWVDDPNAAFAAGEPGGYGEAPSFIAHPPLGKWLMALGLAVFGQGDPVGWRISTAILGVLLVVLTMLVAQRMFRSPLLTGVAGLLLAIDGNAIVMSRVALLDTSLAFFVLLGAGAVLLDRTWADRRLALWMAARDADARPTDWGPALWWRPWLIAASVAFGAASAVKWSGFYFLAAFAVATVIGDALARRRAGLAFWATSAVLKQGPVSLLLTVPVALGVHLASWTGWFATAGGYYRHWVEEGNAAWVGALAWVPTWFQNWWHYQSAIYAYHLRVTSDHAYEAPAWTWLLLIRPTSMYFEGTPQAGYEAISGIANPLLWWSATAAIGFLLWQLVRRRDRSAAFLLVGIGAGLVPWLFYPERTTFQFYTIAFEPFLILGLAYALHRIATARDPVRPFLAPALVAGWLVLIVLVSALFLPIWTAIPEPWWFHRMLYWLPSWR